MMVRLYVRWIIGRGCGPRLRCQLLPKARSIATSSAANMILPRIPCNATFSSRSATLLRWPTHLWLMLYVCPFAQPVHQALNSQHAADACGDCEGQPEGEVWQVAAH